jgi:hypothetical protein
MVMENSDDDTNKAVKWSGGDNNSNGDVRMAIMVTGGRESNNEARAEMVG